MARTPENDLRALIGHSVGPFVAPEPVEPGAIRRYMQAALDDDPRYGTLLAPPLFPLYAFHQPLGEADPLERAEFDGTADNFLIRFGLPPLPISRTRFLNGGQHLRLFACARVGDRLEARSRYLDVYEKVGASGPMVFAIAETRVSTQTGTLLLVCEQTLIWR